MVSVSKNTKKFQKKHMSAVIQRRRKLKPMKNALRRKAADFRPPAQEEKKDVDEGEEKQTGRGKDPSSEISKHKFDLAALRDKDPEFYKFLQVHDKELLDFDDDEENEGEEDEEEDEEELQHEDNEAEGIQSKDEKSSLTLTTALVDEWCVAVRDKHHVGALRSLLQAFRSACHYGDSEDSSKVSLKFKITSSHVFNKILVFVLAEMDGATRRMLGLPGSREKEDGGQRLSAADLQKNKAWKKTEPFLKTYFGNCLHILNQMTDNEMIIFILRRLKFSVPFLGAFPKLARKLFKVTLHFFSRGDDVLPVTAMVFIQEMAQLGEEMLDSVLKGVYKEYVVNAKFVNPASLPRIQFRSACVVALYGIDFSVSYQLAFVFIQQLAIMLRNAISMKTKDAFKRVYCWQYVNSLHLWVKVISKYPAEDELRPLVYPLAQVIGGVAQLSPTTRYFPLRLQCAKMLNELAHAASSFIPVAPLLLDILQFKELYMKATGGVGKAIDFDTTLKVPKLALKTRELQDGCVAAVLEQLCEHLAHWSYAIAFPELAVIPLLQLRQMLKKTIVDRSRRQVKQLIDQIEKNVQFVGEKRDRSTLSLQNAKSAATFLQTEQELGSSPLTKYALILRERGRQRSSYIIKEMQSQVGRDSEKQGDETQSSDEEDQDDVQDAGLPSRGGGNGHLNGEDIQDAKSKMRNKTGKSTSKVDAKPPKRKVKQSFDGEDEADILEDLILSSDDNQTSDEDIEEMGPRKKKKNKMSSKDIEEMGPRKKKQNKRSSVGFEEVEPRKKKQEANSSEDIEEREPRKKKHKAKLGEKFINKQRLGVRKGIKPPRSKTKKRPSA